MTADAAGRPAIDLATLDISSDALPDFLIDDGAWLGDATALRGIVLPEQGEGRARGLLEMGAPRVYLGDAALLDSELVARLARAYGSDSVGVYVPAARMEVSWAMDSQSNADFKTVVPSLCEPAWEILRADGGRTGTLVQWWLEAMFERGASAAIVRVDILDDTDLNLCATLAETFGNRLRFAPRSTIGNLFGDWVRWGRARQLAVPLALRQRDPDLHRLAAEACA